jgi:hypothetical protein
VALPTGLPFSLVYLRHYSSLFVKSIFQLNTWICFSSADVVKSRMQTDSSSGARAGFLSTFRSIYSSQGIRGLYSGLGVTLIRAVPANACIFYCYEMTLRALTDLEKGA